MTRISTLFVVSTTLAAFGLPVSSAGAAQVDSYKPQVHPTVTRQQTPNASVKTPTNPPKGPKKDFTWSLKPTAVKSSGAGK
jgi:hypothetical protein